MASISIQRLHKRFDDGTVAVHDLNLEIRDGELFVLLGPSGCGKTTTLRCIAGLERQTSGDIRIGGRLVNHARPGERDVAMVFQFYALYPHLTAYDNIAFPLRAAKVPEAEVRRRVARAAAMLKIEPLLGRKPARLSGGEQQRVALGRAMVRQPQAFLLDEPLTNLDAELRQDMRTELKHLQQELGATMVHVTHDQVEAMSLGHRIAIMNQGRLEQVGPPLEVYQRPATLFAAGFIGSPPMNLFPVELEDGCLRGPGGLALPAPGGLDRDATLIAGVRPEAFQLVPLGGDGAPVPAADQAGRPAVPQRGGGGAAPPPATRCRVASRETLGDETIYVVDVEDARFHVRMPPTAEFATDDVVGLVYEGGSPPVYDAGSGRAVGS